jgi:hypothetical protein
MPILRIFIFKLLQVQRIQDKTAIRQYFLPNGLPDLLGYPGRQSGNHILDFPLHSDVHCGG